jgi:hypothetical protein
MTAVVASGFYLNKRQNNKLENCCIWLVIYLNCTMMHGITHLKCTNAKQAGDIDSYKKHQAKTAQDNSSHLA